MTSTVDHILLALSALFKVSSTPAINCTDSLHERLRDDDDGTFTTLSPVTAASSQAPATVLADHDLGLWELLQ